MNEQTEQHLLTLLERLKCGEAGYRHEWVTEYEEANHCQACRIYSDEYAKWAEDFIEAWLATHGESGQ